MNEEQLYQLLYSLFERRTYSPKVIGELRSLLPRSGTEGCFQKIFLTRVSQEHELGRNAVRLKEFERIDSDIYSMHLSAKNMFNIRLLYAYLPNDTLIFLHAFYEREGKRKTNYQDALPVAKRRLDDWRNTHGE